MLRLPPRSLRSATIALLAMVCVTFAASSHAEDSDKAKPDAEGPTCKIGKKDVKAGTRWCRAGDFWVCQKDGQWFNLHQSCAGGTRGHTPPTRGEVKKLKK